MISFITSLYTKFNTDTIHSIGLILNKIISTLPGHLDESLLCIWIRLACFELNMCLHQRDLQEQKWWGPLKTVHSYTLIWECEVYLLFYFRKKCDSSTVFAVGETSTNLV